MNIRDAQLLASILAQHGLPEGREINCFGTLDDPSDFVYFKIYPDRLRMQLHRILAGVAAFDFHFTLRHGGDGVAVVERTVHYVEGSNKRIRAALGEAYAKTSIGVSFTNLSQDEEEWVAVALKTFRKYWMK